MLSFEAFKEDQKTSDVERELEFAIDSFLKAYIKNNEKSFIVFYDNSDKNIKFYYDFEDKNFVEVFKNPTEIFEFSENLKGYIFALNVMAVLKNLEEKYRNCGYKVEYFALYRLLRFYFNKQKGEKK